MKCYLFSYQCLFLSWLLPLSATATSASSECSSSGIQMSGPTGEIFGPNPAGLNTPFTCHWQVTLQRGQMVQVAFSITLPLTDPCDDYLQLKDSQGSIYNANYQCGNISARALTISNHVMHVTYHLSEASPTANFSIFYSAYGCPIITNLENEEDEIIRQDETQIEILCAGDGKTVTCNCQVNKWVPDVNKACADLASSSAQPATSGMLERITASPDGSTASKHSRASTSHASLPIVWTLYSVFVAFLHKFFEY